MCIMMQTAAYVGDASKKSFSVKWLRFVYGGPVTNRMPWYMYADTGKCIYRVVANLFHTSVDLLSNCTISVKHDGFIKWLRFWRESYRYASTPSIWNVNNIQTRKYSIFHDSILSLFWFVLNVADFWTIHYLLLVNFENPISQVKGKVVSVLN